MVPPQLWHRARIHALPICAARRSLPKPCVAAATDSDNIGKTVFKIYDPVDLYAALQAVNTMQPLVNHAFANDDSAKQLDKLLGGVRTQFHIGRHKNPD